METAISESALAEVSAKLDAVVRRTLAQKSILAWMMQRTVREFRDMELDDIAACIEGTPEVHSHPVYSEHGKKVSSEITGMKNEDTDLAEGTLRYDILFYALLPDGKNGEYTKIILNVEAQKNFNPGYPIESRAVFYAARALSAQKNTEFEKSDYAAIKKCYSIWICMEAPQSIGNAISEYVFQKTDLIPGIPDRKEAYDKLAVILITLDEKQESDDRFISLMNTLLSKKLTVVEKKQCVENDYGIPVEGELEEGINSMCNYSEMILEEGLREGRARGNTEGRILAYADMGMSLNEIARKVQLSVPEVERVLKENGVLAMA